MNYTYSGCAIDKLLQSYRADTPPFITEDTVIFREQDNDIEEVKRLRELFFPTYWNCGSITLPKDKTSIEIKVNELGQTFLSGIRPYLSSDYEIVEIVDQVLSSLPGIRETLKKDVEAAYKGDPAATSFAEIIRSYPGFRAIMIHRVAHVLYELGIPSYPRELSEYIHSVTGIDIHPGASIGEYFFIDHGTGVVIGETSEIGNNVRIYQGVTLGALHFEKDDNGMLKKGYKRHPTIGDHVVIGMGAVVLGPISVGHHVSIGANSWIQEDIPDNTTVFVSEHPKLTKRNHKD